MKLLQNTPTQCLWFIILLVICTSPTPHLAQSSQEEEGIDDFIRDGHFEQKCIPEALFKPYKFEKNARNNSPDIIYRKEVDGRDTWYWNEFGCMEQRLNIPMLPFIYGCARPGDTLLPPAGYSGDRYVTLIREPGVTEGLVYRLKHPLIPGYAYTLSIAARNISERCHPGKLLVAGSRLEPCQDFAANQLHPDRIATRCQDNTYFIPHHLLLTDSLPQAWTLYQSAFTPEDTLHWLIIAPGNLPSEPYLSYIGIDAIELSYTPPAWEINWVMDKEGGKRITTLQITGTNNVLGAALSPFLLIKPDRAIQLLDPSKKHVSRPDGSYLLNLPLPPATHEGPGSRQFDIRFTTPLDCPLSAELYLNPYRRSDFLFLGPIASLDTPYIYLTQEADTLSTAIIKGLLPVDALRSQTVYIHTRLVVDMPSYTFENSRLRLGPEGRVTVLPGSALTLKDVQLGGCGAPWEGLHLLSGSEGRFRQTRIEHAIQPVLAEEGSRLFISGLRSEDAEWDLILNTAYGKSKIAPDKRRRAWWRSR
jgi:hypothetical protein